MNRYAKILNLLILGAAVATMASADPILTLTPGNNIQAAPGFAAGWGFDLQGDSTYYTSVVSAFILGESNPQLGFFSDFISPQGGPANGVLAPGQDWSEAYDSQQTLGFGEYAILSTAMPGDTDIGQFLVEYQLFSDDPNVCGGCFVSTGTLVQDFQVTATPEPGSAGMLAIGCALCAFARRWLKH